MKNLGGISIDFIEKDNGDQTAAVGIRLKAVPGKLVASALTAVVAGIARDDPKFMGIFIDELGELVGLEDEEDDA